MKRSVGLLGLVDEGLLVWVFTQGKYDSRLHHFKEIPAGTCLIHVESGTDAFRAKEVLAGSQCIEGNVSSALLAAASVDEVEAYCLQLAQGGGFMIRPEQVGLPRICDHAHVGRQATGSRARARSRASAVTV